MRASRRAATFFPLAASYRFCGDQEARQGVVSGARRGLRHKGAVQEGERGEGNKRGADSLLEKWRGNECVFIPG